MSIWFERGRGHGPMNIHQTIEIVQRMIRTLRFFAHFKTILSNPPTPPNSTHDLDVSNAHLFASQVIANPAPDYNHGRRR